MRGVVLRYFFDSERRCVRCHWVRAQVPSPHRAKENQAVVGWSCFESFFCSPLLRMDGRDGEVRITGALTHNELIPKCSGTY